MPSREVAPGAAVSSEDLPLASMLGRVLGHDVEVRRADPLPHGSYNTTLRVELAAHDPVVVRLAPRPKDQLRSERHWLRSEHAAGPYLARLGPLVPRCHGADFTHELVDRDYLVQSVLPGVPAPAHLGSYDESFRPGFFRQLGSLSRVVHANLGEGFGPLHRACAASWSDALTSGLKDVVADLVALGQPSEDAARLTSVVEHHRDRLDVVEEPRLLHGDLWTVNVLLDSNAAVPTVVGVVDADRAWWGDPLADWAPYRADLRESAAERAAFWDGYGGRDDRAEAEWRRTVYRGWHLASARVELARLGREDEAQRSVADLREVLGSL